MANQESGSFLLESKKLGKRLKALRSEVMTACEEHRFEAVWDTCCDHGSLGLNLLEQAVKPKIYFVDRLPHLTDALEQEVKSRFYQLAEVFNADILDIQLNSNQSHLFVVAGVGGELIIQFLESMLYQFQNKSADARNPIQSPGRKPLSEFILSPSTAQYELRNWLQDKPFELINEIMVTDKGRTYEILRTRLVVPDQLRHPVSELGSMWQAQDPDHLKYLNKLINHYKNRIQNDTSGRSEQIYNKYLDLLHSLAPSTDISVD